MHPATSVVTAIKGEYLSHQDVINYFDIYNYIAASSDIFCVNHSY